MLWDFSLSDSFRVNENFYYLHSPASNNWEAKKCFIFHEFSALMSNQIFWHFQQSCIIVAWISRDSENESKTFKHRNWIGNLNFGLRVQQTHLLSVFICCQHQFELFGWISFQWLYIRCFNEKPYFLEYNLRERKLPNIWLPGSISH